MNLAIVGSREFLNYRYVEQSIEIYFNEIEKIISGGAKGADALGKKFAEEHKIAYKEFAADWDTYGKSAGHIRNKLIVDAADAIAAYWNGKSPGTKGTINIADKQHKPVLIFLYKQKQIITLNWGKMIGDLLAG